MTSFSYPSANGGINGTADLHSSPSGHAMEKSVKFLAPGTPRCSVNGIHHVLWGKQCLFPLVVMGIRGTTGRAVRAVSTAIADAE